MIRKQGGGFHLAQVLVDLAAQAPAPPWLRLAGAMAVTEPGRGGFEARVRRLVTGECNLVTRMNLAAICGTAVFAVLLGGLMLATTVRAEDAGVFADEKEVRLRRGLENARKEVIVKDPQEVAKLTEALVLREEKPCRCERTEEAVFMKDKEQIEIPLCEHGFMLSGKTYGMPPAFYKLFRAHLGEETGKPALTAAAGKTGGKETAGAREATDEEQALFNEAVEIEKYVGLAEAYPKYLAYTRRFPEGEHVEECIAKQIDHLADIKDFQQAEALLEHFFQAFPRAASMDSMLLKGVLFAYKMGDYLKSYERCMRIIMTYPDSAPCKKALTLRFRIRSKLPPQTDFSEVWARKQVEKWGYRATYGYARPWARGDLGPSPEDRKAACEWALGRLRSAAEKRDPEAEFYLGAMYLNGLGIERDVAEAKKWFARAAWQDGEWRLLALDWLARDEFKNLNNQAGKQLTLGAQAKIDGDPALARKHFNQAADLFLQIEKIHPLCSEDVPKMLIKAGQAHKRADDYKSAIQCFEAYLQKYPAINGPGDEGLAEAMYWLGECQLELKNYPQAYRIYKKLTVEFPERNWAKWARGKLEAEPFQKFRAGNAPEMASWEKEELAKRQEQSEGEKAQVLYAFAERHAKSGNSRVACVAFKKLTLDFPTTKAAEWAGQRLTEPAMIEISKAVEEEWARQREMERVEKEASDRREEVELERERLEKAKLGKERQKEERFH